MKIAFHLLKIQIIKKLILFLMVENNFLKFTKRKTKSRLKSRKKILAQKKSNYTKMRLKVT